MHGSRLEVQALHIKCLYRRWAVYRFIPNTGVYFPYDINFSLSSMVNVNGQNVVKNSLPLFQRAPFSLHAWINS